MAIAGAIGHTSAASNGTLNHPINGWYPCHEYTFSDAGSSSGDAECAVYTAPLFYPGVSETSEFADPTVDIFVKRLPATAGDPKTARDVWMFQGGPGLSSGTSK
ncbi:hypothetical protein JG688_00012345 [Phytophthora aleatoria]|uniref:Serine protease n=1 Tax=Phytophthora aleatoria TaxID=2496075 RepID=A0A8J5IFE7_9STRA|nr:hypothetical protein JG688_00012345 [Phytophthora aleatoria]